MDDLFKMTETEKETIRAAVHAAFEGVKGRCIEGNATVAEMSAALYRIQDFCGDFTYEESHSLILPD